MRFGIYVTTTIPCTSTSTLYRTIVPSTPKPKTTTDRKQGSFSCTAHIPEARFHLVLRVSALFFVEEKGGKEGGKGGRKDGRKAQNLSSMDKDLDQRLKLTRGLQHGVFFQCRCGVSALVSRNPTITHSQTNFLLKTFWEERFTPTFPIPNRARIIIRHIILYPLPIPILRPQLHRFRVLGKSFSDEAVTQEAGCKGELQREPGFRVGDVEDVAGVGGAGCVCVCRLLDQVGG